MRLRSRLSCLDLSSAISAPPNASVDSTHGSHETDCSAFIAQSEAQPSVEHFGPLFLQVFGNFSAARRHIRVRDISILDVKFSQIEREVPKVRYFHQVHGHWGAPLMRQEGP